MRGWFICACLGPVVLLLLWNVGQAHGFTVEVVPERVSPGDAFSVKVRGFAASDMPEVRFGSERLDSVTCGDGCLLSVGATGLDTPAGQHLISVRTKTGRRTARLRVRKTEFPTVAIAVSEDKVSPSDEDLARIRDERQRLLDLWTIRSDKQWLGAFEMPLRNDLSTRFGVRRVFNGKAVSVHYGLDIRGKAGEPVRAANRGAVVLSDELFFGGKTVIIDHGLGLFTVYMHLSEYAVSAGDMIAQGDVIGAVGATGRASGPHLHFGAKVGNRSVNPLSLLMLPL